MATVWENTIRRSRCLICYGKLVWYVSLLVNASNLVASATTRVLREQSVISVPKKLIRVAV